MNTTLKIVGFSPIYQNLEGETWEVFIQPSSHDNVLDIFVKGGKQYLFELKKLIPVNNKWILEGFLSSEEAIGRISFEQQ